MLAGPRIGRYQYPACALLATAALLAPLGLLAAAPTAEAAATHVIYIDAFVFKAANVAVAVGDTVTWTNNDSSDHTVKWRTGSPAESPRLGDGMSYSRTFTDPGTFEYFCGRHPSMAGKVVVTAPPILQARFTPSVSGRVVTVDATASTLPNGGATTYTWDWGDDTAPQRAGPRASHSYAVAGTYTITLTLDDGVGSSTTTRSVTVNTLPVARFEHTLTGFLLRVNATTSSDADGPLAGYTWSWGDGTPVGSGPTATHEYAAGGTYTVRLTVTDGQGATATTTRSVTVTPPPGAFDLTVTNLTVRAEADVPQDGPMLMLSWTFGDGGTAGDTPVATHTYATAGTYTITVTYTDLETGATTNVSRTVIVNRLPVARFDLAATALSVTVNATNATDPDGPLASYTWDWGDGNATVQTTPTATHLYTRAGTYTIALHVRDAVGATATVARAATVNRVPIAALALTPSGLTVAASAAGSSDPDGGALTYRWDWGDNSNGSSTALATHIYATAGTYTVTLTVKDALDATTVVTRAVTVSAPVTPDPPAVSSTETPAPGLLFALAAAGVAAAVARRRA